MQTANIKNLISMDMACNTPKYLQVSNGLIRAIEQRRLLKGDLLPSIRQLCDQLEISFDTAKKAYDVLKKRNIVIASHGKANVINTSGPLPGYRIFLLLNELSTQKKTVYDAIMHAFPPNAVIDLYVYNDNPAMFRHLLKNKKPGYTHHIIVPLMDNYETAVMLNQYLPEQELIILDGKVEGLDVPHSCIYEDHENDIYSAMQNICYLLKNYQVLNIVVPDNCFYHRAILNGFRRFCYQNGFIMNEWYGVNNRIRINRGELFITLSDEDLVLLIDQLRAKKLITGRDIGIISYNETPLKEVLLEGVTTISTDYKKMGELAVKQIINKLYGNLVVPFKLTLRSSL